MTGPSSPSSPSLLQYLLKTAVIETLTAFGEEQGLQTKVSLGCSTFDDGSMFGVSFEASVCACLQTRFRSFHSLW